MAFDHPSGLPKTYDRALSHPERARNLYPEEAYVQAANRNEDITLEMQRNRRGLDMVAADGNRVDGAEILVQRDPEPATTLTVTLGAGRIYVDGDVRNVAGAVMANVPGTGTVRVGVRLQETYITHVEDPTLLGLEPGSEAEHEPGAVVVVQTLVWALETDTQEGPFSTVYTLLDGTPLDQKPPSALDPVFAHVALYDRDANGSYIVDGCAVTALGKVGADQVFSIEEGTANVLGRKKDRLHAFTHREPEEPDLETVSAEPHTYTEPDGVATTVTVNRPPIAAVQSVIIVKRIEEDVVRGGVAGGTDELTKSSVVAIESVRQGGTTYTAGDDYALAGDDISWAAGGLEPAGATTYTVTYLYNEDQGADSVNDTEIVVSGGVSGQPILATYTSKLPRVDILGLDVDGLPAYVRGVSARQGAVAPRTPETVLRMAEITNDWMSTPGVDNNGTRRVTFDLLWRYLDRVETMLRQFDRSESRRDILERTPVSKEGVFTDQFVDDFFRDPGEPQTASSADGVLSLAIDVVLNQLIGTRVETLPWTEVVVLEQPLRSSSMKINPFANFVAMPAALRLEPAVDFWTAEVTNWTSPVTREFQTAPGRPPGSTAFTEQVRDEQTQARFLQERSVTFTIDGFGAGENLSSLLFDGVDLTPVGPLSADGNGSIAGSFDIPAGMPAGARQVRAEGAAGSFAEAIYVGSGTIRTLTLRRVTLVARAAAPPPPPVPVVPPPQITQATQPIVPTFGGMQAGNRDPLAQTFTLDQDRAIVGLNFRFAVIGDPANGARVQLSPTQTGLPTGEILAEAFVPMATVQVGDLVEARFDVPVFCEAGREYAFVILTDDPDHEVEIARLGDVIDLGGGVQQRVSAQPFTVGVLLASANRSTWTPVQDADLHFEIVAASFTATSHTVDLWTGDFVDISDVHIRGGVELPTAETRVRYELVRADQSVVPIAADQRVAFDEYLNETVTIRAVLEGTATVAPILFPGVWLLAGKIRTEGTYVTRVFPMKTLATVSALFAAQLPAGATVTVETDAADDVWQAMPGTETGTLGNGWTEPAFETTGHDAPNGGRIRISLTGGPGARPFLADLRAYSI